MKNRFFIIPGLWMMLLLPFISCSDNENPGVYDPSKPIEFTSFYPDSGYYAGSIIIEGANFGNDPEAIEVYFNQKQGAVVGTSGDRMYVMIPKLPGDTCMLTIKIGEKSATHTERFRYISSYAVTTLAGKYGGTADFFSGTTFADAEFNGSLAFLTIDKEDNIFLTQGGSRDGAHAVIMLNELNNSVRTIFTTTNDIGTPQVPTVHAETQMIYVPAGNYEVYWEIDPLLQWTPRQRNILHPSAEQQAGGMLDYSLRWKHALAYSELDGHIYTRCYFGDLIRMNTATRVGEKVGFTINDTDAYLYFDPFDPEILFITYTNKHSVYTYNIRTHEHTLYAGFDGEAGTTDGLLLEARFNQPRQILKDLDGNLFIADSKNHCIRKIDQEGVVTTVVGIAGVPGYVDGTPEDALLNEPWGMALDSNGDIYISDRGNRCLRKLAVQ